MSQEELNYEIPTENYEQKDEKTPFVVSPVDIITASSNIDPSKFWIVFMVLLIMALASTVMFGGGYLVEQGREKDKKITQLEKDLRECPNKTLEDLKKQQQAIEEIRSGLLLDRGRVNKMENSTSDDVQKLQEIDVKLNNKLK